ncbi:hypothetical protein ACFVMC_23745 [Nocardia sp. NPDC127579]|uniref:hypothetical protein n=1 Tax=Nocardia sp. NPDC127579 TaxID=3345402 RepID=UPI0036317DEE
MWSNKTTITDITCRQLGRPWRPGRVRVPWTRVVAIEGHKAFGYWRPVLHLEDNSVVIVGAPARHTADRRFAESMDPLRERQRLATGDATPGNPPNFTGPPRTRQFLVALGCAAAIALIGWATVHWALGGKPPTVQSCALVDARLLQQVVPGAERAAESSARQCYWQQGNEQFASGAELSLLVTPMAPRPAESDLAADRRVDAANHTIADLPGLRGYYWTATDIAGPKAQAQAVVGGYRVQVTLTDSAAVEQQLIEVTRAVTEALR